MLADAVRDWLPGLAVIAGAEEIRLVVVQAMPVHRNVSGTGSKRDASIMAILLQSLESRRGHVLQFLPPSRVRWSSPVSLPAQISSAFSGEGAMLNTTP